MIWAARTLSGGVDVPVGGRMSDIRSNCLRSESNQRSVTPGSSLNRAARVFHSFLDHGSISHASWLRRLFSSSEYCRPSLGEWPSSSAMATRICKMNRYQHALEACPACPVLTLKHFRENNHRYRASNFLRILLAEISCGDSMHITSWHICTHPVERS